MLMTEIKRQYDEVIAPHYDLDPFAVVRDAFTLALSQLFSHGTLHSALPTLQVLDIGLGTGAFLERLRYESDRRIVPYGLDISPRMLDIARTRLPDLSAEVDDAARLAQHFVGTTFDLICTHFVTGFVPLASIAPEVHAKLKPGGVWSFVGGASDGYPELRRLANTALPRWLAGGRTLDLSDLNTPENLDEVVKLMEQSGFTVVEAATFEPRLEFTNFDEFMAFAWRGGWLTPYVESLGLHQAGRFKRFLLDQCVFPVSDVHRIVIALARKAKA